MERRIVVTGCGVVTPVGIGKTVFWDSLVQGKSGIGTITAFDASQFETRIAGEVKGFSPPSFILPKDIRKTARFVQFALAASDQALQESGLTAHVTDPYRVGVIIGSGIGSLETIEKEIKNYFDKGPRRISPFMIPMLITNEAAGHVAIQYNLKGINFCTVTACTSGATAIGEAYLAIKHSRADAIVCGGTEAAITHMGIGGFCALRALSNRNDAPEKASRPFEKGRDGFVMSEGAGIVILEELEHAKKRGAAIYAEVSGYGATGDAYHITAPDPEGDSAIKCMEYSLREAGLKLGAKEIYINAHGTSTELNDKMETKAIKKVFGAAAKDLYVSSTKSMMGHTLGAAGAIEFIVCCMVMKHKIIPPTINYEIPDPDCDLNYVPNKAVSANVKAALSNSFGFGGHNATLLVKEFK